MVRFQTSCRLWTYSSKGDIYGLYGVLNNQRDGKVRKRTVVVANEKEVSVQNKKIDELEKENEKLKAQGNK